MTLYTQIIHLLFALLKTIPKARKSGFHMKINKGMLKLFFLSTTSIPQKEILESKLSFPLLVLVQNDVLKESPGIKSSDSLPGQCDLLSNCQYHYHFQVFPRNLSWYGFKSEFPSEFANTRFGKYK